MDELSRFQSLVSLPESRIDLAQAALLIGTAGDPGAATGDSLLDLDRLARGLNDLEALRHRFFRELGFRGNSVNYYDPQNSFLHRVIARRLGIPITLSLLTVEVGRRAGISLDVIGMPGHVLVGVPGKATFMDPFGGGEMLDLAGCEDRFRQATGAGPEAAFGPHLLPVIGPLAILGRMLANLRGIYQQRRSGTDLEWVARMTLALPQSSSGDALALGEALEMQGRFLEAAKELESLARVDPADGVELKAAAHRLRAKFN